MKPLGDPDARPPAEAWLELAGNPADPATPTPRSEAEATLAALRESERRLQEAQAMGRIGSWELDPKTGLIAFSPEMNRLCERDPAAGPWPAAQALALLHPEDAAAVHGYFQRALESGANWERDVRVRLPSGREVWHHGIGAAVKDTAGRVVALRGVIQEITARKRSEKIQEAVYRISQATQTAAQLEDLYREIHQVLGGLMPADNFFIALTSPDGESVSFPYVVDRFDGTCALPARRRARGLTEHILATGQALHAPEEVVRAMAARGEVELIGSHHVDWIGVPLKIEQRSVGVMALQSYTENVRFRPSDLEVLQFVSTQVAMAIERKRAEAERRQSERQRQQLQKAESLNGMAKAIAHQFNNQLQVVMGNLELARNVLTRAPEKTDERLVDALKAARKAAEVSGLMLTYLGQTLCKLEALDLSEICRASLPVLRAGMPSNVVLEADLPAPGPAVLGQARQLQQVLANLVTNAWEASPGEPGLIGLAVTTVTAGEIPVAHRFPVEFQPEQKAYACLEVRDTKGGIPEKDLDRIFDPFFTTKFIGRGLGLAVVLGMVRTHSGAVTVESQPGRGSVFRVYVPVSAETVPQPAAPRAQAPLAAAVRRADAKGGTVLVIEDEPMVRQTVALALPQFGYAVLTAADGVEGVKVFEQHREQIGCVLCDLSMPRMDGWETLAALRKLAPDLPVLLASGYSEAQALAGGHLERPQAFLQKPYQFEELQRVIDQALAARQAGPG